jgi:7-cyano-7-deazaguanine reductase
MKELLLGRHTPVVEVYSPELLYPIPRSEGRAALGLGGALPFHGVDVWYAYEMSWLDDTGRPVSRVGRFTIPATSANLVESKSFKLYLNSLNSSTFSSDADAIVCIEADIGAIAGETVQLELFLPDDAALRGHTLEGVCLDNAAGSIGANEPCASQIEYSRGEELAEEKLFSHVLRSLCPVTGQPDWATVWIHYRGSALDHASLLGYIIAYRQHQEFHEQCVERMFCDIQRRSEAQFLHIQAFYTRRGGLDISPFRSTELDARPQPRLNRQ